METAESAVPSAQQTANRKKDDREGPNAVSPLAALTHDRPEALLYRVYKRYISRPSAAAQYSEFLSTIVPIPISFLHYAGNFIGILVFFSVASIRLRRQCA